MRCYGVFIKLGLLLLSASLGFSAVKSTLCFASEQNEHAFIGRVNKACSLMTSDNTRRQMLGLTIYLKYEVEKHSNIKINLWDGVVRLQEHMASYGYQIPNDYIQRILYGLSSYKSWLCDEDDYQELDDNDVPMPMVYGVTTFLCGFFLYCCPVQACKPLGKTLMSTGGGLCLKTMAETHEEKRRSQR